MLYNIRATILSTIWPTIQWSEKRMMDAKAIADSTLAALDVGTYVAPDGTAVAIRDLVDTCVSNTRMYAPGALADIYREVVGQPAVAESPNTHYSVVNQTTLQGCTELAASQEYQRIGVLNFASARNPGGGFRKGMITQEETLARSSALYPSLCQCPQFYQFHRNQDTCLYSDRMIYSPACPVLRDDEGEWLARPYTVDFITSPAPNAGAVMRNEPANRARIVPTLTERGGKVLALAAHRQCDALVLGAWGCGIFQNDRATVAQIFASYLRRGGDFYGRFRHVRFAVYDRSHAGETYGTFVTHCGGLPHA
jgi:uncharacterized protein (TIGR02452 family)